MSGFLDATAGLFYRIAASGYLPARWFSKVQPEDVQKARRRGKLKLEIVSHCWRYGHYLVYQLSSLVRHRTDKLDVTMSVYYSSEDETVTRVLRFFEQYDLPGVNWNWVELPKEQLFRRSIGRNLAAKSTTADWVWFTDCDVMFHEGCLDTLADELQGRDDVLLFPRIGLGTALLPDDDPILINGHGEPALLDIPIEEFTPYGGPRTRAQGPYQITHGDVARACGYCEYIGHYQKPSDHWRKAYEDRAFRWLMGTPGTPIDVPGACQIRHVSKGRYKKDSAKSKVREFIRRSQDQRAK